MADQKPLDKTPLGGNPSTDMTYPTYLQGGRQNHRRPTSGQGRYINPGAWGVSSALERGVKSEVAHKWTWWLHSLCRLGSPHRFTAGGGLRSGPQAGKMAT